MSKAHNAPNRFLKSDAKARQTRQIERKNTVIAAKVTDHVSQTKKSTKVDGLDPIGIANEMWHIFQSLKTTSWMAKDAQEKITDFNGRGYQDFNSKYAIVARYMLINEEYSPKAFEKYLFKLRVNGFKDQDGWADRQADYVKYLFIEYNKREEKDKKKLATDADVIWRESKKNLLEEVQSFKKDFEEAKTRVVELQKELDKKYREDLRQVCKTDPAARAALLAMYNKANKSTSSH